MRNFIWIVCLLITAQLFAQSDYAFRDADLVTGSSSKLKYTIENHTTNLLAEGVVFQLRHEKLGQYRTSETPILASYDFKTMNLIAQRELELRYENKELDFLHINLWAGELVVFSSFYNKKTNTKYVFVQTLDKQTLAPNNDLKKIGEITNVKNFNQARLSNIQIRYAPDSSKIAIRLEGIRKTSDIETFNMTMMDINRNILWSKSVELPYKEKEFKIDDFLINSNGDIFFLGKKRHETTEADKSSHDYKIVCYGNSGLQKEYTIALENKLINQLRITPIDENTLVCAGFYTNINGKVAGTFYTSLDLRSNKFIKESYQEFDEEILDEAMNEKELKKFNNRQDKKLVNPLSNYQMRGLIRRSDGGAVLVGEQYKIDMFRYAASGGRRYITYYFYYNNIMVVNINPSGDIDWVRFIRKNQCSTDDNGRFSSYAFMLHKDKMHFIFNDNIENIPYNKDKTLHLAYFRGKAHVVSVATLDAKGNQERFELSRYENDKRMFLAKSSGQITAQDAILTRIDCTRKDKVVLQRLTFK